MKLSIVMLLFLLVLPGSAWAIGAIAVDDEAGSRDAGYGLVTGHDSKEEALNAALAECRKSGNENCKKISWFESCGAYAASTNYYGAGWGKNRAAAEEMALDKCGSGCHLVVVECE